MAARGRVVSLPDSPLLSLLSPGLSSPSPTVPPSSDSPYAVAILGRKVLICECGVRARVPRGVADLRGNCTAHRGVNIARGSPAYTVRASVRALCAAVYKRVAFEIRRPALSRGNEVQ